MPEEIHLGENQKKYVKFHYRNSQTINQFAYDLAWARSIPYVHVPLVWEGGNFLTDEDGTLYGTKKHLKVNNHKTQHEIEYLLTKQMLVKKFVWFDEYPEEATGHIDMFVKFVGKKRVVVAAERHFEPGKEFLDSVAQYFVDHGFLVTRILNAGKSESLKRSYINALQVNNKMFVPRYSQAYGMDETYDWSRDDEWALTRYRMLGFDVVSVDCQKIITSYGALHCLTKQTHTSL
jgi:agmatine/peptidylarginine deiminase